MTDVSAQPITQGIVNALRTEFGENYAYYINRVPQHFHTPSFYVRQVSGSFDQLRGRRYMRRHLYMVTYFPEENGQHEAEDMQAVLCRMYPVLEYIQIGTDRPLRGTEMSHDMEERELHMSIHYDMFVVRPYERPTVMEVLEQQQHLKEE